MGRVTDWNAGPEGVQTETGESWEGDRRHNLGTVKEERYDSSQLDPLT